MNKANFYIYVNGKEFIVEKNITLIKLIKDLNLEKKSFAIAVNSEVVKKENYKRFTKGNKRWQNLIGINYYIHLGFILKFYLQ